jgi:hypothetical protein
MAGERFRVHDRYRASGKSFYLAGVLRHRPDSTGPTVPTPWVGDPDIMFVGCTTEAECGKYDAAQS